MIMPSLANSRWYLERAGNSSTPTAWQDAGPEYGYGLPIYFHGPQYWFGGRPIIQDPTPVIPPPATTPTPAPAPNPLDPFTQALLDQANASGSGGGTGGIGVDTPAAIQTPAFPTTSSGPSPILIGGMVLLVGALIYFWNKSRSKEAAK